EQPRDAGVLQARQDSPLTREAPQDLAGVHAALDELHRDFLLESAVSALAEIDLAHTATAEGFDQAVDAHNLAAQIGDASFVGFGFITSVARMRIMVGFVEARPSAPVIGARDGSEVGQQFEWIEQWAFYLVHAGVRG